MSRISREEGIHEVLRRIPNAATLGMTEKKGIAGGDPLPHEGKKKTEEKRLYLKKYYEAHKEEVLRKRKKYLEGHKEEVQLYRKKYYEDHKEEVLRKRKKYLEDHKEEVRLYRKKYYEDHKEERKHYQEKYYEDHKEEVNLRQRKYYENHTEEFKSYRKKYYEDHKEKFWQPKREQPSCDCCGEKKAKLEINIIEDRPVNTCEGCREIYRKYSGEEEEILRRTADEDSLRMTKAVAGCDPLPQKQEGR